MERRANGKAMCHQPLILTTRARIDKIMSDKTQTKTKYSQDRAAGENLTFDWRVDVV